MDSDTRWLVLRDLAVFPPAFHTSVVCQRDMGLEVLGGQKERRQEWVVDSFTGKSWGRVGTGKYLKWSPCPPAGMMRSPQSPPPTDKLLIVCCTVPKYFGIRIGRFSKGRWEIHSDILSNFVIVPNGYVEGYLWLP